MNWFRKLVESRYFNRRTVVIAVGTKADGTWQAVGVSGMLPTTKRLLVTTNGETHVNWVEAKVWFPREPDIEVTSTGLEAPGASGPQPRQQQPPNPPQPATGQAPLSDEESRP